MERYECQLPLQGFGKKGQEKLKNAKVLIIGMGGLGCPVSQYLVSSGIGTIGICDFDKVSLRNLHRQILYEEKDIGRKKVNAAKKRLEKQNSEIKIITYPYMLTPQNVLKTICEYDIVVDCTDNFDTKYLLNDACVILKKPLVYGSIIQYEGQVSVFNFKNADGSYSPNYKDIFPDANSTSILNCEEGGVIPTIAGIIGSIQANEVIKYISGVGSLLSSKLFIFDARQMSSFTIDLPAVTKAKIDALDERKVPQITANELKKSFNQNFYKLVDVRTREEHDKFNIGGENIPLDKLLSQASSLKFKKPTVFYCRSGRRSGEAVKFILQNDPKARIMSLNGGIKDWR